MAIKGINPAKRHGPNTVPIESKRDRDHVSCDWALCPTPGNNVIREPRVSYFLVVSSLFGPRRETRLPHERLLPHTFVRSSQLRDKLPKLAKGDEAMSQ